MSEETEKLQELSAQALVIGFEIAVKKLQSYSGDTLGQYPSAEVESLKILVGMYHAVRGPSILQP